MGLLGNLYCETIAFEPQSSTDDLQTLFFGKSIVRKIPLSFIEYYTDPPHVISTFIMLGVYYYKGYEVVQLPPDSRTVVREACFQYPEGTEFDAKASDSHRLLQFTSLDAFSVLFHSFITHYFVRTVEDCEIVCHYYSHYWRLRFVLVLVSSLLVCWNATLEKNGLCILNHDSFSRLDAHFSE
jgi:hypothetical protein